MEDVGIRCVLRRTGDRHVDPGERARLEQRVCDVVAAVADERDAPAGQVAERLLDRQQVGERLARMVLVESALTTGTRRPAGELVDRLLRERADHDRVDVARERAGGVGDRLAAPELQLLRRQRDRRRAEPGGGRRERDARPCRRLLEDAGDRPAAERVLVAVGLVLHRLRRARAARSSIVGSRSEIRREVLEPASCGESGHRHHPVTTVSGCAVFARATIGSSTSASVGEPTSSSSYAHVADRVLAT